MKKILLIALSLIVLPFFSWAQEGQKAVQETRTAIENKLSLLEKDLAEGDWDKVSTHFSQKMDRELYHDIANRLEWSEVTFTQEIQSIEPIPGTKDMRVETTFHYEGDGGKISGFSNYYLFTKENGQWKIYDTDFHKFGMSEGFLKALIGGSVGFLAFLVFLGVFWLWMLIHALIRPIDNKVVWVVVILFLGILGAILYFFIERRNYKKQLAAV